MRQGDMNRDPRHIEDQSASGEHHRSREHRRYHHHHGSQHTAHTHAHGSRSAQRPRHSRSIDPLEASRLKCLSSTELLYPSPEAATAAFQAERERRKREIIRMPRSATPFARGSDSTIMPQTSQTSMHSHLSSASGRSHHTHRSRRSHRSSHHRDYDSDMGSDIATVGPYEQPRLGPHGEPIEVIGLGRKQPRHRTLSSQNLKPALRNSSSNNNFASGSGSGSATQRAGAGDRYKPLPNAPSSYIAPVVDNFIFPYEPRGSHQARHASSPPGSLGVGGLRSLFSSFSLDPSSSSLPSSGDASHSNPRSILSRTSSRRRQESQVPADDLFDYLHRVELPAWTDWPGETRRSSSSLSLLGGDLFGGKGRGLESMSWEWRRRWEDAESARAAGRMLSVWEGGTKRFEKYITDWAENNVPSTPIDANNRWGSQIFALAAEGYDTLEFHEDGTHHAEDFGLLSWLTGSLLATVTSALNMLRYSSQHFSFHLIPAPRPAHTRSGTGHALWEGFGTLALVNKSNDLDRAVVIEVRPPGVVDYGVLREFTRDGRAGGQGQGGWYHVAPQYCVGDAGQANLLQAQVYDSCVQNQVFFFVFTNLKHWVFGQFDANYTRCTVSPIIERKHRVPSVMQFLVGWVVRSVDERPRAGEQQAFDGVYQPTRDAPPYSSPPRRPERRVSQPLEHSRSPTAPQRFPSQASLHSQQGAYPYPQADFNTPHPAMQGMQPMLGMQGMGQMPPGYFDVPSMSPTPAPQIFHPGQWGMHPGPAGSRPFSPLPGYNGVGWYSGGMSWPGMRGI